MQPAAGPSANHTAAGSGDHAPVTAQSRGWAPAEAGAARSRRRRSPQCIRDGTVRASCHLPSHSRRRPPEAPTQRSLTRMPPCVFTFACRAAASRRASARRDAFRQSRSRMRVCVVARLPAASRAVVTAVTRRRPFRSSAARADGFNFSVTVLLLPPSDGDGLAGQRLAAVADPDRRSGSGSHCSGSAG